MPGGDAMPGVDAGTDAGVLTGGWSVPVGGNRRHDGLSEEAGPTEANLIWSRMPAPSFHSHAYVTEGNVLVIGTEGAERAQALLGLDVRTGEELWSATIPAPASNPVRRVVPIAAHEGMIFVTYDVARMVDHEPLPIYALDAATGAMRWASEDPVFLERVEAPAVTRDGDLLVRANASEVMLVRRADGTTAWRAPARCSWPGCNPVIYGDRFYVWQENDLGAEFLSAYEVATGVKRYDSNLSDATDPQASLFIGPDGTIYAPSRFPRSNEVDRVIIAFQDTGIALREKWRQDGGFTGYAGCGIGPDGSIYTYVATPRERASDPLLRKSFVIARLDPATGAILARSPQIATATSLSSRMAIDRDGRLFVINHGVNYDDETMPLFGQGVLYSFDADLTLRWMDAAGFVPGIAIARGGVLIAGTETGEIRAYGRE